MKQLLGFQCPKCKTILYTTGVCSCGELGYIKENKSRFERLYTDAGKFHLVFCYIDDSNRLVRYTNYLGGQVAPTLFINDEDLKRI